RDDYDDYDDRDEVDIRRRPGDESVATLIPYRNPKALIAYYCGVFSLIPGGGALLGPLALILGCLGIAYVHKYPTAKGTGHAITAIILGLLTSLAHCGCVGWVIFQIATESKR